MDDKSILKQMIEAREEYIRLIKAELLGPGSEFAAPDAEHELISNNPKDRYSVGILYPQGNRIGQDNNETIPIDAVETDSADELVEAENLSEKTAGEKNTLNETVDKNFVPDNTANENLDEEIVLSTQYMPSSMGVTFIARGDTAVVRGSVSFATYKKAEVSDIFIPFEPDDKEIYAVPSVLGHIMKYDKERSVIRLLSDVQKKELREIFERDNVIPENEFERTKQIAYRLAEFCRRGYVRVPHSAEFELDFSNGDYFNDNKKIDGTSAKITALRTKIRDGWSLTVMLVNTEEETCDKNVRNIIFQPMIRVESAQNKFVFVEINTLADTKEMDEEERSLDLLYREHKNYGTGLGVAVDWDIDHEGNGRIWSDFFPKSEVPPMSFDLPKKNCLSAEKLSMKYLSDLSDEVDSSDKLIGLQNLVNLYKDWVKDLKETAATLDPRYKAAATANIAECERAYKRMDSGIETLKNNDKAYAAFELANRAMFMQRVHLKMQSDTAKIDRYPGDEEIAARLRDMDYRKEDDYYCIWRPFQLAFMLMDINSIVDDKSEERDIVDLIWFPTGGGKTEAYLGLTAFTIFYRRLAHAETAGGTAVIMRYTLRLLTAQQFTRAATLICACEFIRKDCKEKKPRYPSYEIGEKLIRIGLWIGSAHTPNKNDKAKEDLDKLCRVKEHYYVKSEKDKHNKFQVLKCPWCGTKLVKDSKDNELVGDWGYKMRNEKHFYLHCTHESCDYKRKLPIQIVDEELYDDPPALLFGTVDKFAMLAWNGDVGAFFGSGDNRAPELIIQDELHLISGALGTIVGLYETAVDAICAQGGIRPKIIASTATIRRAKEQCSVLYNRKVVQFPAPGLNAEDSFFAREAEISYENNVFGRKYIGVMPSGKTKATTEIRAMAALLQKAYTMELPDEVKDKLWTLTVYFNSLKDLGNATTLVNDAVKETIRGIAKRMLCEDKKYRHIFESDELTSRVTTTELNETLDKLEKLEYSRENIENKRYASNVLLATNMISVGIDIARLNVMLMVGQPKLTSEYIQASSRVGRSFPGVAFVQYDATKSRDRSHYERFKTYHESFYRFVEPTSATPFSKPARERALHAVLAAMLRHTAAGLNKDEDAVNFDLEYFSKSVSEIRSFVIERIRDINRRAGNDTQDDGEIVEIKQEIDDFFELWERRAKANAKFFFGRKYMVNPPMAGENRLFKPFKSKGHDPAVETLTAMRNVDSQVKSKILIWEK